MKETWQDSKLGREALNVEGEFCDHREKHYSHHSVLLLRPQCVLISEIIQITASW